ncbi:MAG: alkaline phosphatase family protein [Nitrospirae bacterium CG18_big_fil_WC_8_21_14_2_50_70_55]|nr:alkaline phosphatase family protein [Deltaproteobacteria bacterium]OIP61854.1 MAG: alkaline phosphatase family protein [Nitrospirae bacterium CG2_30_70_394]PIQ04634.1 MAG: alkaline phosphatase family protein [Nitrospirae bacterium CG18_big_fil_WC_8_21_14_2_50_70_55]PIU79926.1 MAG: alkaline phosphatase family protein [Nitrospirae bacterium CG06_land_8_20_14_3_00_70_43]PIW82900.1 MAG: alkaline phosphatase family protein [Nitrospirae bacterium CG_4_8_14_3_um_filter_70_85]PIX83206.1 MAG: alkali
MSATRPLVVIDVVGLTRALMGAATPNLNRLAADGFGATLTPPLPALTCTSQATLLTGLPPRDHGIVANGWYFRDLAEVLFWRQANRLVQGEKVWETARRARPTLTCANLFWWYNMGSTVDWSVTPRPVYPADGSKIIAIYGEPPVLPAWLEEELGPFPFFHFWGPLAGLASSQWIAAAARLTFDRHRPDLTLVYLPHLDYDLQRFGPDSPAAAKAVREIDTVAGALIDHVRGAGAEVVVCSEYGIEAVDRPVYLNRVLREAGWLRVRETAVGELLDPFVSRAFAVADHQVAHLYLRDPADMEGARRLLGRVAGVEQLLDGAGQRAVGLDHPRSGELVAVAAPGAWFTYDYWLDDARAPDFARTVDIHRKPGYDPRELFLDPTLRHPQLRIARRLLQKRLGMRYLMDVIPLDGTLVRGSHGRLPSTPAAGPVLLGSNRTGECEAMEMAAVRDLLLRQLDAG